MKKSRHGPLKNVKEQEKGNVLNPPKKDERTGKKSLKICKKVPTRKSEGGPKDITLTTTK